MAQRRVDKEKMDRADRAFRIAVETERQEREAKSARLREQRLFVGAKCKGQKLSTTDD
jgi:hypothetical protein